MRYWISKITHILRKDWRMSRFLETQYLMKETFFWAEVFRTFYLQVGLLVDKISGRNIVISAFGRYHAISDWTPGTVPCTFSTFFRKFHLLSTRDVRCQFTEHRPHRHWCHWSTGDPSATEALKYWKHRHWCHWSTDDSASLEHWWLSITGALMTQHHWSTETLKALTPIHWSTDDISAPTFTDISDIFVPV